MSKFLSFSLVSAFMLLLFASAFMPGRALAGQNIIIDGTVTHAVFGNGNAADNGCAPIPSDPASLVNPPNDNTVTINSGATVGGSVSGGYIRNDSNTVTASGNGVAVNGGTVNNAAYGGYASSNYGSATATGNSVAASGGTVNSGTFGGYAVNAYGSAAATDNSVAVSGGTVNNGVYGGSATSSFGVVTATGNSVTVSSGTAGSGVFGGYALSSGNSSTASGNNVTVNGGTIASVFGGRAISSYASAEASGNSVTINGGTLSGGTTYGGNASNTAGAVTASNNSVTVSGGNLNSGVAGGYTTGSYGSSTALGNSVTISGGSLNGTVVGGYATSYYGSSTASGNSVTISGGTTGGGVVYGGAAQDMSGTNTSAATDNSVYISGGTVGDIYGGRAFLGGAAAVSNAVSSATGNTITLSGAPDLTSSNIYGGFVGTASSAMIPIAGMDAFSGNTLNVWDYNGSAAASVQNFERYNFVFPASQSAPVLEVSGTAVLGDGTRGSLVTIGIAGDASSLQVGDSVTLISGTIDNNGFSQTTADTLLGVTLRYNWALDASSGTALTATLDSMGATPQAKALSEGWLAGMALVNQGADAVAGPGMSGAVLAAQNADKAFAWFGSSSGGRSRYNTGSHVDVSGISLLTGLAYGMDLTPGRLTLGAFFEYGNGSYDTHNSFSTAASVDGDGDMYHIGGGILGRMDFANTGPGRFYAEASARAGKVYNEYDSSDLRDYTGRKAEYDASSVYYGLHLGAGYIWNITETASLDLYGKYFWTRQEGDSVTLSTGDRVKFKASDSHRLRLGSRFTYAVNEYVSPYVGAAWEHEFYGKVRATTYSYNIDEPSLRGDTGIGELGITLTPKPSIPLSFDFEIQGYVGQREGVTGALRIKYEF